MELRRGVDAALIAALSQSSYPVLFAFVDWPEAPVRVHTGVGTITWGGHDWSGVGGLGSVDVPPEGGSVAAVEAMFTLAGLTDTIEEYADDQIRGRAAELYIGAFVSRPGGSDGNTAVPLVGVPTRLFSGLIDGLSIVTTMTENGVTHEAKMPVITGVEARSAASIYHTDEDQKRKYPEDTAGRHVILAVANAEKLRWPEN